MRQASEAPGVQNSKRPALRAVLVHLEQPENGCLLKHSALSASPESLS